MSDNDKNQTDKEKESTDPEKVEDTSKRQFIKNTGIAAGGVVGGTLLGGFFGNFFGSDTVVEKTKTVSKEAIDYSDTRQFFKRKADFDVLSMATERIFPEDSNGPGAIKLGAPYFIDKQLASPWGNNAEDYMEKPFPKEDQTPLNRGEVFIRGLRKLNEVAQKEQKHDFIDLEEEQQIELLKQFESDEIEMNLLSSAEFFELLRQSTLEGCYADPMYGGNKNMKGWKMKEFPGARLTYIDYVEEEEFVSLDPVSLKSHNQ